MQSKCKLFQEKWPGFEGGEARTNLGYLRGWKLVLYTVLPSAPVHSKQTQTQKNEHVHPFLAELQARARTTDRGAAAEARARN